MTAYSLASAISIPTLATSGNNRTFSLTPIKVGNLGILVVAWQASTGTITSVSSTNAVWGTVVAKTVAAVTSSWAFQIFFYLPTSTSAATVTIAFSANPTAVQPDRIEFTADWLGKNPANWLFAAAAPKVTSTNSTAISWPSLTGFSFDDFFLGYCFPSAAAVVGTNGTPTGFLYANDGTQGNGFAWHLTYGVGPSIPVATQATTGVYIAISMVFALYPSLVPATIDAGST